LQVGVHIQLTHSTLTKQVIFMPYYVLVNNASYIIECQEADRPADPWIKVDYVAEWQKFQIISTIDKHSNSWTVRFQAFTVNGCAEIFPGDQPCQR
jgi:hypothetical protein